MQPIWFYVGTLTYLFKNKIFLSPISNNTRPDVPMAIIRRKTVSLLVFLSLSLSAWSREHHHYLTVNGVWKPKEFRPICCSPPYLSIFASKKYCRNMTRRGRKNTVKIILHFFFKKNQWKFLSLKYSFPFDQLFSNRINRYKV